VFSIKSVQSGYKEDNWGNLVSSDLQGRLRKDGAIVELTVDKSCVRVPATRGLERENLKNIHCLKPLPGNDWLRHSKLGKRLSVCCGDL
jgi:hypothetical protein